MNMDMERVVDEFIKVGRNIKLLSRDALRQAIIYALKSEIEIAAELKQYDRVQKLKKMLEDPAEIDRFVRRIKEEP
jgi:hypothetical protein